MEYEKIKNTKTYQEMIERGERYYDLVAKASSENDTSALGKLDVDDWLAVVTYINADNSENREVLVAITKKMLKDRDKALEKAAVWKGRFYAMTITSVLVVIALLLSR